MGAVAVDGQALDICMKNTNKKKETKSHNQRAFTKDKLCVGRDLGRRTTSAIAQLRGDLQSALLTYAHAQQALVPALDDLALA